MNQKKYDFAVIVTTVCFLGGLLLCVWSVIGGLLK